MSSGDQTGRARPHAGRPVIDRSREDRPGRGRRADAAPPTGGGPGILVVDPRIQAQIVQFRDRPGALLPLLHAIQAEFGYVPPSAVPAIASGLNLSRAEVHGVIAYYTHFHDHPLGRHVVQVCRAESCKACGADELVERAAHTLDCAFDSTRADGAVTLESVYCLGLCAISPAASIDGKLYGRLSHERFDALLDALDLAPVAVAASVDIGTVAASDDRQQAS